MSRLEDNVFDPNIGVSNRLKYALTRESMLALVDKENLDIIYPKDNDLFIDLDSDAAHVIFGNQIDMLHQFMDIVNVEVRESKSGLPNRHAVVTLGTNVSAPERIALQASLGSDRRCELLRYKLYLEGDPNPTLFLEKKKEQKLLGTSLEADLAILTDEEIPY
jgi:hypothetical protein